MTPLEALTSHIKQTNPTLTSQLQQPFKYNSLLEFLMLVAAHYELDPPEPADTIAETVERLLSEIKGATT